MVRNAETLRRGTVRGLGILFCAVLTSGRTRLGTYEKELFTMRNDCLSREETHFRAGRPLFDGWAARKHLWMLIYWPVYGALFFALERACQPVRYHVMHTGLDDLIPFCEAFVIPYVFWFLFLIGIHCYTAKHSETAFRRLMAFVAVSHTCALAIFFLFPSCQHLRPLVFERHNLLTQVTAFFYRIDTSTNVCPSLHVVGSMAVWYAARDAGLFSRRGCRVFFSTTTVLICLSTVFLKQHSVLDVAAGLLLSDLVCRLVYRPVQRGYSGAAQRRRDRWQSWRGALRRT